MNSLQNRRGIHIWKKGKLRHKTQIQNPNTRESGKIVKFPPHLIPATFILFAKFQVFHSFSNFPLLKRCRQIRELN